MKLRLPSEFLYQVFALLFAVILVHAAYVGVIRPSADSQLAVQAAQQAAGEAPTGNRSLAIVIKDYEQEACFILMLWALAIMGLKASRTRAEGHMLNRELIAIPEGTSILPRDAREQSRSLEALALEEQDYLLPRALANALSRFTTTGSIPAVSDAVREQCDIEADRLDSELSMVRYISWAIPSIGFIGTVRGIGDALGQAYKAVEGDISGVTVSLGVAFNSTFVALVLSIIIMFALHQLQLSQERLVLNTQRYIDRHLLRHLSVPPRLMQLLDCNDASLRLWRDGLDTWSPGFVRFSDGHYQFGEPAWQQARRAPREINNRYWHRLSTQDLSPALGPARHTADLVHAHLESPFGQRQRRTHAGHPGGNGVATAVVVIGYFADPAGEHSAR